MPSRPPFLDAASPRVARWAAYQDTLAHVLLIAFVAWLGDRLLGGTFTYSVFTDRELVRGMRWWEELPTAGAEVTGRSGGRVPGPLLILLFAIPRLFASHAGAVYALQILLVLGSVVIVHVAVARRFGAIAGLVAGVVWATTPVHTEVVRQLWNPGMVPFFAAVATAGLLRATVDRDGRGLAVFCVGIALGAQLHLSVLALGIGALPALVLARPRGWARGLGLGLALAVLAYLPFVVSEVRHGFPDGAALVASDKKGGVPILEGFRSAMWLLAGWTERAQWEAGSVAALWALTAPAVVALLTLYEAVVRATGPRARRGDAVALVGLGGTVLVGALLVARGMPTGGELMPRYLTSLGVPLAVLAGVGVARAIAWCGRRHALLGALAVGASLLAAWPRVPALAHPAPPRGYLTLLETLGEIRARTGWSLAELVGRTTWATEPANQASWDTWVSVEHLLLTRGEAFPGSRSPPCALVIPEVPADATGPWPPERVVDAYVPSHRALVSPPVVEPLPFGLTLLLYDRGEPCPTTMTQRYVESDDERTLRAVDRHLVPDRPLELDTPAGRRFAVRPSWSVDAPSPIRMLVDVVPEAFSLRARLTSPQLRGIADNVDWYDTGTILRPRIVLVDEHGEDVQELVIADDLVGPHTTLAPVERWFPIPPGGPWRLDLAFELVPWRHGSPRPPDVGSVQPWRGTLVEASAP